ncbi:MAG TPA: hypothetical protein PLW70_05210 [Bacteroidales bacterium]|nr:hypothetical protein [Bacteroidales bacterium]HQB19596.1 hypothetical protein [Bacteroidales bacterium]
MLKKTFFVLTICCFFFVYGIYAQSKAIFKGKIIDFLISQPLENTYIHNLTTGATVFSNDKGDFSIGVRAYDTIAITRVGYNPEFIVLNDSLLRLKERVYIRLLMKSIMLREVKIYAIKPYPLFKKEMARKQDSTIIDDMNLSKEEKAGIVNSQNTGGNIVANTPLAHPFTFLYEQYSRKAKMQRQYNELMQHQEEIIELAQKYNPEIVQQITGLTGNELEEFMVYCSFTYYTLIVSQKWEIEAMIRNKYQQYKRENAK